MTRSSSMKLVSATTSTSGKRCLTSAVAAIPSITGISRSIRTTSGSERLDLLDRAAPVVGLAHDLDVVEELEEAEQAAPDDGVVVDEQDPDPRRCLGPGGRAPGSVHRARA